MESCPFVGEAVFGGRIPGREHVYSITLSPRIERAYDAETEQRLLPYDTRVFAPAYVDLCAHAHDTLTHRHVHTITPTRKQCGAVWIDAPSAVSHPPRRSVMYYSTLRFVLSGNII